MIRFANERGTTSTSWLTSYHSFSFGEYHDPRRMGFHALRVINDDIVAPAQGFGMHPHRDMEIITIILAGALEHRDSLGHSTIIRPGDVQAMSAGTGIRHSEVNASKTEPVHLLQIWILPDRAGHQPSHAERTFPRAGRRGTLVRVAGRAGQDEALPIHQDADCFVAALAKGERVTHTVAAGHVGWVHAATGAVRVNGEAMNAGDDLPIEASGELVIEGVAPDSDVVLFDLAE